MDSQKFKSWHSRNFCHGHLDFSGLDHLPIKITFQLERVTCTDLRTVRAKPPQIQQPNNRLRLHEIDDYLNCLVKFIQHLIEQTVPLRGHSHSRGSPS